MSEESRGAYGVCLERGRRCRESDVAGDFSQVLVLLIRKGQSVGSYNLSRVAAFSGSDWYLHL